MSAAGGPVSWLDLHPRDFDPDAPDVQLSMFAPDPAGNVGPGLFDSLDDAGDGAA